MMIPVHLGDGGMVVDVFASCQNDEGAVPQMVAAAPLGKRPEFQRTVSGELGIPDIVIEAALSGKIWYH